MVRAIEVNGIGRRVQMTAGAIWTGQGRHRDVESHLSALVKIAQSQRDRLFARGALHSKISRHLDLETTVFSVDGVASRRILVAVGVGLKIFRIIA
jgi:hypothetical protein